MRFPALFLVVLFIVYRASYHLGFKRGFDDGKTYEFVENSYHSLLEDTPVEDEWIFRHKCESEDCETIVEFDDEPYCFTHSPDEGSSLPGYSARRKAMEQ